MNKIIDKLIYYIQEKTTAVVTVLMVCICTLTIQSVVSGQPYDEPDNPMDTLGNISSIAKGDEELYNGLLPSDQVVKGTPAPMGTVVAEATDAPTIGPVLTPEAVVTPVPTAEPLDPDNEYETLDNNFLVYSSRDEEFTPSVPWVQPRPSYHPTINQTTAAPTEQPGIVGQPTLSYDNIYHGENIEGTERMISVTAYNAIGEPLTGRFVTVRCNGVEIEYEFYQDATTYFRLPLYAGFTDIEITATDISGNTITYPLQIYTYGLDYETITVSVEAEGLGLGYIIPPTEMMIEDAQPLSYYVDKLLRDNGFAIEHYGSIQQDFALNAISKDNAFVHTAISDATVSGLQTNGALTFDPNFYSPHAIGTGYYTTASSWMYSLRNKYTTAANEYYVFRQESMSAIPVSNGDQVRVQFTLDFGRDIGAI